MPALNLGQLRTRISSNIGNRTDKNTIIDEALNEGLEELVKRHYFRDAISEMADVSVVADASSVALPSDVHQVIEARLIDGTLSYPFIVKSKKWVTSRWPNISEDNTGKPTLGYIEGDSLYLYPVSSGSYKIRATVVSFPDPLIENGDVPGIKNVDSVLTAYATSEVFASMQDFESAGWWLGKFERRIQEAIRSDQKETANDLIVDPSPSTSRSTGTQPWLDPFTGRTGDPYYGT